MTLLLQREGDAAKATGRSRVCRNASAGVDYALSSCSCPTRKASQKWPCFFCDMLTAAMSSYDSSARANRRAKTQIWETPLDMFGSLYVNAVPFASECMCVYVSFIVCVCKCVCV